MALTLWCECRDAFSHCLNELKPSPILTSKVPMNIPRIFLLSIYSVLFACMLPSFSMGGALWIGFLMFLSWKITAKKEVSAPAPAASGYEL